MGPWTATEAMKRAVGKAEATGIGCVSIVNANDIARLGGYVEQPAKDGFIALLMANDAGGNPCVAPWGATSPLMSTNPMAVGIPREAATRSSSTSPQGFLPRDGSRCCATGARRYRTAG